MNEQKKRELMLKAAAQFNGVWREGATHIMWSEKYGGMFSVLIVMGENASYRESGDHRNAINTDPWKPLCTKQEFEDFINSLFDDAPYGAEYYHKDWGFVTKEFDEYISCKDSRMKLNILSERQLIQRPCKQEDEQVEWSGEGLPPVGVVCEYTTTGYCGARPAILVGEWYKCTVIAYYNGFVWTSDNGLRQVSLTKFRPIKTEAEKERDSDIEQLANYMQKHSLRRIKAVATSIYDELGWRPSIKSDSH